MPRKIKDLLLGTEIWIQENSTLYKYILIHKDDVSAVILRDLTVGNRRMHSSNVSNYEGCEMDNWLCDETSGFMARFSDEFRSLLIERSIAIHNYGDTASRTIPRKCYLLSEKEMFNSGSPADGNAHMLIPLLINKNTIDANTARICRDGNNVAVNWWLRSPFNATQFRVVFYNGTINFSNATSSYAVRPALSISLETIVSDEGADTIIVLPEEGRIYYSINAKVNAGHTHHRPAKARVIVNADGLTNVSVKICNNYKDENPVWYDATGGGETVIENDSKTSDEWEIGVWLYGEGHGTFNEPLIITEEE